MSFLDEEIADRRSQPLARLATVSADGQPDVVPVAFEWDGAGRAEVALVVDDHPSSEPFVARGSGCTAGPSGRSSGPGSPGPATVRIAPTVSWSWNMAGEPVGEDWCPVRRAVHG